MRIILKMGKVLKELEAKSPWKMNKVPQELEAKSTLKMGKVLQLKLCKKLTVNKLKKSDTTEIFGHFLGKRSLKVSNFLHDGRRK